MIKIGVLCPSEIALRRFLPALKKLSDKLEFVGVAIAKPEEWFGDLTSVSKTQIEDLYKIEYNKALLFGGKIYNGYENFLKSNEINAIYIPLPPSLHYKWAKIALENRKHVLLEKPSTFSLQDTRSLIQIAKTNGMALHENYMFVYHNQINEIRNIVDSGEIGDIRLIRLTFGFPKRQATDFRYNKELGGGALFDAGGYCLKYASILLKGKIEIATAKLNYINDYCVDVYGSATLLNENGDTVQLAFGMDNDYRCEVEIWGSKGTLTSNRVFTAPVDFRPICYIKKNQSIISYELSSDDSFYKSILTFQNAIFDINKRQENYEIIYNQAELVDQFINK